jgi:hypothetical protein
MTSEIFATYEAGLMQLLKLLGSSHPRYAEVLTLQSRLLENIARVRQYGHNEIWSTERTQILATLDQLTLKTLKMSFHDLCESRQKELVSVAPAESSDLLSPRASVTRVELAGRIGRTKFRLRVWYVIALIGLLGASIAMLGTIGAPAIGEMVRVWLPGPTASLTPSPPPSPTSTPTPMPTPTSTPTPTPTPIVLSPSPFTFEDTTVQCWAVRWETQDDKGKVPLGIQVDNVPFGHESSHALGFNFQIPSDSKYGLHKAQVEYTVEVGCPGPITVPSNGEVSAWLFVRTEGAQPPPSDIVVELFVQELPEHGYNWHASSTVSLVPDQWTQIIWNKKIDPRFGNWEGSMARVGIEVKTDAEYSGWLYIDDVIIAAPPQ